MPMLIGDLFERDVTRAIPPVIYFHEQAPEELEREVREYIITGGYGPEDPRATPDGIHEQFVRLLKAMHDEMEKDGGPELPASWISGFFGSGKSSFAKLLGLALDGRTLPNGLPLADALLAQDHSPAADDLKRAWHLFVGPLKPIAVVFDIGSHARDDDQIHSVVVRQVQRRFGYSTASNFVADYELALELEKKHPAFMDAVLEVHGKPWGQLKDSPLAEDYFSAALHKMDPKTYPDPMSWVIARSGSAYDGKRSADAAVKAIADMIEQRYPGRTLFIVIDEVSQYVHDNHDRMLALQSFVSALGQRLRGKVWLLATGQQQLEAPAGANAAIVKLKDRFPPSLRVHLGIANIREVVHKRLLRKKKLPAADLAELFRKHRADIALNAYKGDAITETDFVEVYPMLPGHVSLLLDITSGLRSRSERAQNDASAIRGLLQLLGDLFRDKQLARFEVGHLVTIDMVFDQLHSALPADVQLTISRGLEFAGKQEDPIVKRVIKAVAMLELIQDPKHKTSAELVARCLYAKLGEGDSLPRVQAALDALVAEGLLGMSETRGYKIESTAGQEWQRERDGYSPTPEQESTVIQTALTDLLADTPKVVLEGLALPWLVLFSDDVSAKDVHLKDERKHTVVTVDFQLTKGIGPDHWIPRSDTEAYRDRIVWVVGDVDEVRHVAKKLVRSARMIERYANKTGVGDERQRLVRDEENRLVAANAEIAGAIKSAFLAGRIYFRGRETNPRDVGTSFTTALSAFATRAASDLYPNPITFSVLEKDALYLIENADLSAPPPVFGQERLGLLSLDAGRYELTCNGRVPSDVFRFIKQSGATGSTLLAHFGGPPHGVPPDVLRAVVLGLLRAGKIRVEIPGESDLTSVRDQGARELLKETVLRKARITENTTTVVDPRTRTAICNFFKEQLGKEVARDNDAIADAVAEKFGAIRDRLDAIATTFRRLPKDVAFPKALTELGAAIERCRRDRKVEPTVLAVKRSLDALRDGMVLLRRMETDLTPAAIDAIVKAEDVLRYAWPGLAAVGASEEARAAAAAIEAHLRTERPWEDAPELTAHVERIRSEVRARRRAILDAHERAVEAGLERLKRRPGFDRLDPDQRHAVLHHLREGGAAGTDENAIAPALEGLETHLAARRDAAERKAITQLDATLEAIGATPVVEVTVELSGREIENEAELDRLLVEIRTRVVHELSAHHRVRLRGV